MTVTITLTRDGDVAKILGALEFMAASTEPDVGLLRSLGYKVQAANVNDAVVAVRELATRIREQVDAPGIRCPQCGGATIAPTPGRPEEVGDYCEPCGIAWDPARVAAGTQVPATVPELAAEISATERTLVGLIEEGIIDQRGALTALGLSTVDEA